MTFDNNNLDADEDEPIEKYKKKLLEDQAKDFVNNGDKLKNNKKNNNNNKQENIPVRTTASKHKRAIIESHLGNYLV